jgi:hypothetical protein
MPEMKNHNSEFRISPIYDEDDGAAYALSIYANNATHKGYAEVELVPEDLKQIGTHLCNFPQSGIESEVLWDLSGMFSASPSQLRFYIRDHSGHAGVQATLTYGDSDVNSATIFITAEVATFNRLGQRLIAWASGKNLENVFEIPIRS